MCCPRLSAEEQQLIQVVSEAKTSRHSTWEPPLPLPSSPPKMYSPSAVLDQPAPEAARGVGGEPLGVICCQELPCRVELLAIGMSCAVAF